MEERYDPLKVEREIMEFWKKNDIPRKVMEMSKRRSKRLVFRFLEGPPTANGYMHVGHARGRTIKDIVLRFWRMQGYWVWDQAGWDTQGLPVELEVEKRLGFRSKKEILKYGVDRFIEECQRLVDHYVSRWVEDSLRLGLWLDYDHAYQTRNPRYLDMTWTYLKKMFNEGRVYEDLRVVAVCPRCETALSSHEVALGYKKVQDPSLYFKIPLKGREKTYLIAWTTTPWTIISNEGAAVHPEETYVMIDVEGERWILAEKRLNDVMRLVKKDYKVIEKFKGKDMEGWEYVHPLLEEVPAHKEHERPNHTVIAADFVTMEEGTGIVHMAPAHGAEDFEVGKRVGLIVFKPLQKNGIFGEGAGKYKGMWFKDAEKEVIKDLKEKGLVVHVGTITHDYPHCWRCGTPLMYYADKQWFIKVEDIRERLVSENDKVKWHPKWAYHRMKDWLENARDWTISRERFWGTPLPIWTCDKCGHRVAVGSLEELKRLALNPEKAKDHHRPWVDEVVIKCPKCGGIMRREPYVVDVWLDSGVAHTAALHQYSWDDLWELMYPYDWITEALDQTRGWFYTLLVTGVTWHGRRPYNEVLTQGHVLDEKGQKMSKSKGNVVWARNAMETYGADVIRYFLMAKAAPWDSVNFDPKDIRRLKRVLDILWNSVKFALSYMELDGWELSRYEEGFKFLEPEDHWALSKMNEYVERVANEIINNNIHHAARAVGEFITEVISHKYITLIRPRVWEERESASKLAAYTTLFTLLDSAIRMMAPFVPFLSEYLYQNFQRRLGFKEESVHMLLWPEKSTVQDEEVAEAVEKLLKASERILALRTERKVKRRWPLPKAWIEVEGPVWERAKKVLATYANILEVELGKGEGDIIEVNGLRVYVKVELTEEVKSLATAKELVRRIQVMRKEMDLPLDYIVREVRICSEDDEVRKAVELEEEYIRNEVRAERVTLGGCEDGREWEVEGKKVKIEIVK